MFTFKSMASSSAGNVNLLTHGETTVILDCGLPWRKVRELVGFDRAGDMPILISHAHKDHCKGVIDRQCRNDVYMSKETKEALNIEYAHNYHVVEHGKTYMLNDGLSFVPFSLVHDEKVPCFGYLIASQGGERAAYITDTAYVPNRLPPLSLLAIECNYCEASLAQSIAEGKIDKKRAERVRETHFGLENVVEFLKASDLSRLREIHLLHLSGDNSDELQMIVNVEYAAPNARVFAAAVKA